MIVFRSASGASTLRINNQHDYRGRIILGVVSISRRLRDR
jgi:hypothetical protein